MFNPICTSALLLTLAHSLETWQLDYGPLSGTQATRSIQNYLMPTSDQTIELLVQTGWVQLPGGSESDVIWHLAAQIKSKVASVDDDGQTVYEDGGQLPEDLSFSWLFPQSTYTEAFPAWEYSLAHKLMAQETDPETLEATGDPYTKLYNVNDVVTGTEGILDSQDLSIDPNVPTQIFDYIFNSRGKPVLERQYEPEPVPEPEADTSTEAEAATEETETVTDTTEEQSAGTDTADSQVDATDNARMLQDATVTNSTEESASNLTDTNSTDTAGTTSDETTSEDGATNSTETEAAVEAEEQVYTTLQPSALWKLETSLTRLIDDHQINLVFTRVDVTSIDLQLGAQVQPIFELYSDGTQIVYEQVDIVWLDSVTPLVQVSLSGAHSLTQGLAAVLLLSVFTLA